ncbi:uncharacterized protein METZ01_LOCUS457087, partial [marine metagenome]
MTDLFYPDYTQHQNLVKEHEDLGKIYSQPMAVWLGRDRYHKLKRVPSRIKRLLKRAKNKTVVFVIYSI